MLHSVTGDAVDLFAVEFTSRECMLGGRSYPLGFFAAEALDRIPDMVELQPSVASMKEALEVFLTARDASSAGMAYEAIGVLWRKLMTLPVYERLIRDEHRAQAVIPDWRNSPEAMDEILTPGTDRHTAFRQWLSRLETLERELKHFAQNIGWMLEDYFEELPSRKREAYAEAFADYCTDVSGAIQDREEYGEEPLMFDLDTLEYAHPVNLTFVCSRDSETGLPCIAERMTFEKLSSFLYVDLYRGMAAGNLPRRCAHCGRWFLTVGGYNTMYCDREIPGSNGKTCRIIGAHEREKAANQSSEARKEYSRIYNKLKARKQRGTISTDQWNRQVAAAQRLKDAFAEGRIDKEEYVQQLDAL